MKKLLAFVLILTMSAFCLVGCGGAGKGSEAGSETDTSKNGDGSLKIVTTIFPNYDWIKNILGDKAETADITMLLDNGVDLHSYQPTADDIMKISTCDMFVYVGGESDKWVDDALKEAVNKDMVVINLLETLGDSVKEEEIVEGMEAEEEEDGEEGEEGEEEVEYDEHVWLSLKNAQILVDAITEGLSKIDAAAADSYKTNAESYKAELKSLDDEYRAVVDAAGKKTLLFGDRFPFRYLVDDYGLDYYAAFVGCSAETEASFETVIFLAKKIDELSLNSIMTIDKSDKKIAETIKENTTSKDQEILTLDSMQGTTSEDVKNGVSYLSVMRENLEVLKNALK